MRIPSFVLRKLYVRGSLRRDDGGVAFTLRNTLATATLTELRRLRIDGRDVPPGDVRVAVAGREVDAGAVRLDAPLVFPRNADAEVRVAPAALGARASVRLEVLSQEFGELVIEFDDALPPA